MWRVSWWAMPCVRECDGSEKIKLMTLINVEQSEPKVYVISNDRGDIFFIFKRG